MCIPAGREHAHPVCMQADAARSSMLDLSVDITLSIKWLLYCVGCLRYGPLSNAWETKPPSSHLGHLRAGDTLWRELASTFRRLQPVRAGNCTHVLQLTRKVAVVGTRLFAPAKGLLGPVVEARDTLSASTS